MNDKQVKIIEKAIEVFSRYGVRKATMGDIADHAQISRQTLYASYKNKDDILVAAIQHAAEKTILSIETEWKNTNSIDEILDVYLEYAVVQYFEIINQMPDANDLLTGFSENGTAEMKLKEKQKQVLLEKQFSRFSDHLEKKGTTPEGLAEFFVCTSSNFKFIAQDIDHLNRLIASLKLSTLVMLGAE